MNKKQSKTGDSQAKVSENMTVPPENMAKIDLLSPKRQRFVREYVIDLKPGPAAIKAGFSAKTAVVQASRMLTRVDVQEAVAELQKEISEKLGISTAKVLYELDCLAHYDPRELAGYNITGPACIRCLPENLARAIIGWSWDKNNNFVLKLAAKTAELTLLGKHLGTWNEVGSKTNPLTVDKLPDDALDARLAALETKGK